MLSRRQLVLATAALVAASALRTPADAQQIVQIGRDSPERKPILDAVRAPVERLLGIKVIFVVERMTMFGDWALAALHPRSEGGDRIDYRRALIAKDFDPEQDSDFVDALVRRSGSSWTLVEHAFLPTDVVWEEWQGKYELPRALTRLGQQFRALGDDRRGRWCRLRPPGDEFARARFDRPPGSEVVERGALERRQRGGGDEGQALQQQHDGEDVDLAHFFVIGRVQYRRAEDQQRRQHRLPEGVEIARAAQAAFGGSHEGQMVLD
jgi:hypothetical protein